MTQKAMRAGTAPRDLHEAIVHGLRETGVLPAESACVPLPRLDRHEPDSPADSPSHALVIDETGRRVAVLAVSSPTGPDLVARAVENAARAREVLGPRLGSVVLVPRSAGAHEGLSFALWPWRRPLSDSRWRAFLEKRRIRPRILAWLQEVARTTSRPAPAPSFESAWRGPLGSVGRDSGLPDDIRRVADRAFQRLEDGQWQPRFVLEHGDCWMGNALLPIKPGASPEQTCGFILIDWAGARFDGYPFLDLLRFCKSGGIKGAALRRETLAHCAILGCAPEDAFSYTAAGFGALGLNLDRFPRDRFHALTRGAFDLLSTAL